MPAYRRTSSANASASAESRYRPSNSASVADDSANRGGGSKRAARATVIGSPQAGRGVLLRVPEIIPGIRRAYNFSSDPPTKDHRMTTTRLPLRSEVPVEHTWDLSSLFRSDAEWETAFVE